MCYSAEASFIAGGVLAATSISIARIPKDRASVPLSIIPAVFAAHQLIEGAVWLSQEQLESGWIEPAAVFLYVLIAYIFWPIFIPYCSYRMEPDHRRKWLILICQIVGLAVGLNYLLGIMQNPVGVSVKACNLSYQVGYLWNIGPAYIVAVSVPFLVSSHKGLVLFGMAVVGSAAATLYLSSQPGFPSVWCFFAAILSAGLYAFFKAEQRAEAPQLSMKLPV